MAPANTADVASVPAAADYYRYDAPPPVDRKVLPSYSPPLYSQSQTSQEAKTPLATTPTPTLTPTPLSQDVKVLPFRDLSHADQLPPIQTSSYGSCDSDARHKPLPSISSVTGSVAGSVTGSVAGSVASSATSVTTIDTPEVAPYSPSHWPSLNPLTAYYTPGHAQASAADSPLRMDVDNNSTSTSTNTGPTGTASPDQFSVRASSVSLEDPDVRMAAEALGDLRADFVSSPPARNSPLPGGRQGQGQGQGQQAPTSEPLFSLLTTSHPLLAKTIEGTTSAYNTSKNYSPRFKSGAEYVEGYLTPIGNTIGSVSRVTGVEGGVRWFLGGGRRRHQHQPPSEGGESSKPSFYKRRKVDLRRGGGRSNGTSSTDAQSSGAASAGASSLSSSLSPSSSSPKPQGASQTQTAAAGRTERPLTDASAAANGDRYGFHHEDRRLSMSTVETLPAYDDHRSPDYTESVSGSSLMRIESANSTGTATSASQQRQQQQQQQQQQQERREAEQQQEQQQQQLQQRQDQSVNGQPAAWQTRLIMSTSGLSVAMSEESLRSLKYCLHWLRWANGNIDKVIESLKSALDQYDSAGEATEETARANARANGSAGTNSRTQTGDDDVVVEDTAAAQAQRNELAARIATLRGDLLHTLRGAVDTVSKYAGGALPDNARVLVRRHLTSLPQRFRLANQAEAEAEAEAMRSGQGGRRRPTTDKEVREGAQRVLVLAKEGLDMMSQVSGVLDGTIVSAEEWCERLGKKNPGGDGSESQVTTPAATPAPAPAPVTAEVDGDVVMQ
ncbi:MAG: transcriptional regulator opi1 [Sporothrix thermara]